MLAVDRIVVTSFINSFVRRIFPSSCKITHRKSGPVCISALGCKNKKTYEVSTSDVRTITEDQSKNRISVARRTVIPPTSELSVHFVSAAAGIEPVESKPLARGRELVIFARGVANILLVIPFFVLVPKFFMKPVHLPRTLLITRGTKNPTLAEQPADDLNRRATRGRLMRFINRAKVVDSRCGTIKTSKNDNERVKENWSNEGRFIDAYVEFGDELVKMLSEF